MTSKDADDKAAKALADYLCAVQRLQGPTTAPMRAAAAELVMLREALARALASVVPSASMLEQIAAADGSLLEMSRAGRFHQVEDHLQAVSKAIAPPPGRWWFQLQDAEAEAAARTSWCWLAATGTLFALFVSITTDVTARFFKGGPDVVGMLGTIAQAAIGLLTGAAFTGAGARWLDARMKTKSIPARFRPRVHFGMTLAAALLSLALYLCLPRIAAVYNNVGVGHQDARRVLSAIDAYQRAIALAPDFAAAHYNLGVAYESLNQVERAITSYRTAIMIDEELGRAHNNLARLLLLEGKSAALALQTLDDLIRRHDRSTSPPDADERYAALKNRAWAYMTLNEPYAAERDLQTALKVKPNGASAHCLLARLNAQEMKPRAADPAAAKTHWRSCVAHAAADPSLLAAWLAEAQRQVLQP